MALDTFCDEQAREKAPGTLVPALTLSRDCHSFDESVPSGAPITCSKHASHLHVGVDNGETIAVSTSPFQEPVGRN